MNICCRLNDACDQSLTVKTCCARKEQNVKSRFWLFFIVVWGEVRENRRIKMILALFVGITHLVPFFFLLVLLQRIRQTGDCLPEISVLEWFNERRITINLLWTIKGRGLLNALVKKITYKKRFFLTTPLILLTDNCCSHEDNNVEKVEQVSEKVRNLTMMKLILMMCMIVIDEPECDKYIRIFEFENLFGYSFVSFSWYEYIRIFIHVKIHTNVTLCCTVRSMMCSEAAPFRKFDWKWFWRFWLQHLAGTLWNPYLIMFAQMHGANMQIHKYKHGLKGIVTPSTYVPKLKES